MTAWGKALRRAARAGTWGMLGLLPVAAPAATVCTVAATGVAFGRYDPLAAANNDSNGSITVRCSGPLSVSISFGINLTAGNGSYATRRMVSGANTIAYNLYTDPLHLNVWGDGSVGTLNLLDLLTITVSPMVRTYPIYGRIPARQTTVAAGSYSDTILVTLSY